MSMSVDTAEWALNVFWYLHLLTFLTFLCYLPYSKHSHVLTIPFQVFFRRTKPTGVLQPIPNIEEAELRRREAATVHLEAAPRQLLVHRVRALHGGLPGERYRQAALAQARDPRHPPADGRAGAGAAADDEEAGRPDAAR
jgi:hypothetical protein